MNTTNAIAKPTQKALMSNACLKGTVRCLRFMTVRSRNSKTRIAALKTTQNQMCMDDLAADREHDEISHAAIIAIQKRCARKAALASAWASPIEARVSH